MSKRCLLTLIVLWASIVAIQAQSVRRLYTEARAAADAGDYPEAIAAYRQILDLLPQGHDFDTERVAYSRPYTNLLLLTGAYGDVEKLLSDSIYSDDPILQLNLISALGYIGKYDEAGLTASRLLQRNLSANLRSKVYQNLGFMAMERGDYARATGLLRRSLSGLEGTELAIARSNLALSLAHADSFSIALPMMRQSLKTLNDGGDATRRDYIRCLRKLAEIYYLQGDRRSALSTFSSYYLKERQRLTDELARMSRTQRLNLWLSEKPLLSRAFVLEDYAPDFMYELALFRRQTSLLGMQNPDRLKTMLDVTPRDIRAAMPRHGAAVEFVSYTDPAGKEAYAAIVMPCRGKTRFVRLFDSDFIYQRGVVGDKSLFDVISGDSPDDKNALYNDTILAEKVWAPILDALPGDIKWLTFAPEGIFHFWGIENMYFERLQDMSIRRVSTTANIALAQRMTEKADTAGRVLLVGGLDYSSNATDTTAVQTRVDHEASRLLRSFVDKNNIFNYLPGTRAEVDTIGSMLGDATLLHVAPEAALKKRMPGCDIIHIATHGYALDPGISHRPEIFCDSMAYDISLNASALALTGANRVGAEGREDGLLSARELCDIDLSGVDFVVLSACRSAQGNINDEGAAGLVRGLKNAGVGTVMASLWSVDDRSTMLFMQEFYRQLQTGKSKHDAYRAAQKHLREYVRHTPHRPFSPATLAADKNVVFTTTRYDEPFYWAPFIIIDDL